jgi:hypothetical protein
MRETGNDHRGVGYRPIESWQRVLGYDCVEPCPLAGWVPIAALVYLCDEAAHGSVKIGTQDLLIHPHTGPRNRQRERAPSKRMSRVLKYAAIGANGPKRRVEASSIRTDLVAGDPPAVDVRKR